MEWHDAQEVDAGHRHARYPEEDDVVAGLHDAGGVVAAQIGGVVGPAKRAERPEPRAEPGVEHVWVLGDRVAAAMGADQRRLAGDGDLAAMAAVPGGDAMAPPELARDVPVANVLQP